jgi:hypothetical protein
VVAGADGSDETLENTYLMRMAGRFSRRIRGYAKAHGIPVIDCSVGPRKDDLAEEYLAKTTVTRGLFLIMVGRAQAPVWDLNAKHHIEQKSRCPQPSPGQALCQSLFVPHPRPRLGPSHDQDQRASAVPHPRYRRTKRTAEWEVTVERPAYDLTIFKLHCGKVTLKIYSKGERVLRIEAVAHNTQELNCGRSLHKFPEVVSRLKGVLERFADALSCIDQCFIADEMLEQLPTASQVGKTIVGGIDLNKPRIRLVVEARDRLVALTQRLYRLRSRRSGARPRQ